MEEMKMGTYVLADKEGRILTNKEGYPRIWFSQNQAKRDAKSIFVGVPLLVQTGLGEQIKNKDWRIEMK